MQPAGVLVNRATGRFHPIVFRRAPLPNEGAADENTVQRHKSIGHHTEGFATIDEAERHIKMSNDFVDKGCRWDWDGEGVPAMVHWF